jgi:4'-phosphopantetheinyl transferase
MTAKPSLLWPIPPRFPRLDPADLHVWCVWLDEPDETLEDREELLSPDEHVRAQRLRFPRDRRRFVTARAVLRRVLARYLDTAPAELRFAYGAFGKPSLVHPPAGADLQFNLSHSGALAVYAVTRGRPVGIDVEQVRELDDLGLIAGRFFSAAEAGMLEELSPAERAEEFFRLWTQREALGKARGVDLDEALRSPTFDFSPYSWRPQSENDREQRHEWRAAALSPAPGYLGTVALGGRAARLRTWQWRPALAAVPPAPASAAGSTVLLTG